MTNEIEKRPPIGDKPLDELGIDGLWVLSARVAKSEIVPKEMRGKPENVYLAALWARENNVPVIQALQGVYVVNGRLSVFGDLFLAQIQRSPHYIKHKEWYTGKFPSDDFTAHCAIWRKGHDEPFEAEFSIAKAKRAHLWGKQGPWSAYPERMLMMRARTFAGRDGFSDALKGITTVEEARDIDGEQAPPPVDLTPGRRSFGRPPVEQVTVEDVTPRTEEEPPASAGGQADEEPQNTGSEPATQEYDPPPVTSDAPSSSGDDDAPGDDELPPSQMTQDETIQAIQGIREFLGLDQKSAEWKKRLRAAYDECNAQKNKSLKQLPYEQVQAIYHALSNME